MSERSVLMLWYEASHNHPIEFGERYSWECPGCLLSAARAVSRDSLAPRDEEPR